MGNARRLVAGAILWSCLAIAVAAVSRAPSAVSKQSWAPAEDTVLVQSALPPTDRLTQNVSARAVAHGQGIEVATEPGLVTNTEVSGAAHAAVDIRCTPGVTDHLVATGQVALGGWDGPCHRIAYAPATTQGRYTPPRGMVQSDQGTPSPEWLHDVRVSGDVVALGTPVSAYILVHPSDGRCPWSYPGTGGYRSDDSGRFERTCSDAWTGSTIDVLVIDDAHDLWRRSYRVESGESGPKPIEVRAVLTPRPTPEGPTPTPTAMDELNWTLWTGRVRGLGRTPLAWAHVSLQGCLLSPVHTDDQGYFELVCYGGHGLRTEWLMVVLADGYERWEKSWRFDEFSRWPLEIDLVPLAQTATATPGDGDGWPQTYVPIVLRGEERDTIPTAVTAPPSAMPGPATYFFLETRTHQKLGPGCERLFVDWPTYSFNDDTGVLHVYGGNPRLEPSDFGFVGSGSSLGGRGSGAASGLSAFASTPFVHDALELRSIDGSGSATLKRGTAVTELEAGAEWRRMWSGESPGEPGCVVTDTYRISNYGLQDRRKIVYSADSAGAWTRQARARSRAYACE
jgi:hypothetical protein